MIINKQDLFNLLELGGNHIYYRIENEYNFYAQFDSDMKSWIDTMNHFGSYGQYYEMVEIFNCKLFN
tara:strand:- start:24434 stop:24634 length:201 start_codon:yes stop_codon:yes gene_type:complete